MASSDIDECKEYKVGTLEEFGGDEEKMEEVSLGEDGKCLLIKGKNGEFSALGHKCTHYGAPLINGVLSNGRVRCPWHGACFNATTGDIEDFPGVDSLPRFKVALKGNDVFIVARKSRLANKKRNALLEVCNDATESRASRDVDLKTSHRVVIVGGGPATLVCAETLRKEGFKGQIVVLCKDKHSTYDRPKLSKALDVAPDIAMLRHSQFYKEVGIEFYLNTEVLSVDVLTRSVGLSAPLKMENQEEVKTINYDDLILATGGKPRTLAPTPGWDLQNVFVLRTISDANAIAGKSKGKHVVIVGSSFIGMEIASFLAGKNESASVSVICGRRSSVPFERSFGKEVGKVIMDLHKEKGVKFYPQMGIENLSSATGKASVEEVTLTDGQRIKADLVVVGTGVLPATEFLRNSEIPMDKSGYIPVDGKMKTKVPHVYAIGDIVLFPLSIREKKLTNVQHWQMAHQHGKIAACDIARTICRNTLDRYKATNGIEKTDSVRSVPFFWTVQYGISIRYAGYAQNFDDVVIKGSLDERKFVAYYLSDDVVVAVATMKMDPVAAKFAEELYSGKIVKRKDIPLFV